jgi:hypothetical protein
MAGGQGSWTGGTVTGREAFKPRHLARAVFHPAWIPPALDPAVERLKRVRLIAGTVAAVGVYTFVEGGFAFGEVLENMLTASAVLLFVTPLTVAVMLFVWRRGGRVRALRQPLLNSLKLLLAFVGTVVGTVLVWRAAAATGLFVLVLCPVAIWLSAVVIRGAVHISGNFFGTAGVHRCLPPLLATVTTWLMALSDLLTGDLHGLGLALGIVFILGAPVTVTGIALLEAKRLRDRYGIRLRAHPATLPPAAPPMPPVPPAPPSYPPGASYPYVPGASYPYAPGRGSPYVPGTGSPYGSGGGTPCAPPPGPNGFTPRR